MRLKAEPGCGEITWVGLAARKLERSAETLLKNSSWQNWDSGF